MLLLELFEDPALASLKRKLRDAKAEVKSIQSRGASVGQGAVAPQYKTQFDRAKRAVKALEDDIAQHHAGKKGKEESRAGEKELAAKRAAITPEDKKKEFSQAVKAGQQHRKEMRGDEGNSAIIKKVKAAAKELTVDGKEKLNADQLAKKVGVPTRTLYKYLEWPELHSVQSMLPGKH